MPAAALVSAPSTMLRMVPLPRRKRRGRARAALGKALFERDWVPAPASTGAAEGLSPLLAARSRAGGGRARHLPNL